MDASEVGSRQRSVHPVRVQCAGLRLLVKSWIPATALLRPIVCSHFTIPFRGSLWRACDANYPAENNIAKQTSATTTLGLTRSAIVVSYPPEVSADTISRLVDAVHESREKDSIENLTTWRRPLFYHQAALPPSYTPTTPTTLMHLRPACAT